MSMLINFRPIKILKFSVIALLPFGLVACNHSLKGPPNHLTPMSAQCIGNAFLQKYDCSIDRIQQAAENGDPDAEYALGYMYYYGIDTVQDTQTAQLWIKKAAVQGQPLAIKALQLMNQGRHLNELHPMNNHYQAGNYQNGDNNYQTRRSNSSPYQQKKDVAQMNASMPSKPLHETLPAYKSKRMQSSHHAPTAKSLNHSVDHAKSGQTKANSNSIAKPPLSYKSRRAIPLKASIKSPIKALPKTASKANALQSFASMNEKHYTLQLMGGPNLNAIKGFMRSHHLEGKAKYYKTAFDGKAWYMLVYGAYPSARQAEAAARKLSPSLRSLHPWVKSFHIVKEEIQTKQIIS